ncbi:MAG: class I SAM-dependent RNA methyltransferase [Chlamydiota bacterium]
MITGTIETLAFGGEGILRDNGLVIFVPFTAPGDRVTLEIVSQKKSFAKGRLVSIQTPSPLRTEPPCPYFGTCGGCQLQHLNYTAQVEAKKRFITDALQRIGKISPPDFTVTPAHTQWDYRRHIRLHLKKEPQGFSFGYYALDNNTLLPVNQCPIFLNTCSSLFSELKEWLKDLPNAGIESGHMRVIKTHSGKFLLAFDFMPQLPDYPLAKASLPSLCQGVLFRSPQGHQHFGNLECTIEILGIKAEFSPFGFVQNHPEQNEKLYSAILKAIPENTKKFLDLYCGIGLISLLTAKKGIPAIGIESHPETIALAKKNAQANAVESARFITGKVEREGMRCLREEKPDTVLCNPPRTGLDLAVIEALIEEKPTTVLYVSCMPSTLARDLQKLIQGGYRLIQIEAFDMFPQTTHVETLAILRSIK